MSVISQKALRGGCLVLIVLAAGSTTRCQPNSDREESKGILLLAHGGSKEWNSNVQSIAEEVNRTEPTEVAFGMADRRTLQAGIDKLIARGVKEIIAVPLFVSSHSSVIEATRYLLGLRPDAPPELAEFAMPADHGAMSGPCDCGATTSAKTEAETFQSTPVKSSVPVRMGPALDRHPILADILADRAAAMSRRPKEEALILVAHGPNDDRENALWLEDLSAVAKLMARKTTYAQIAVTTVRDDAEEAVRNQATEHFRKLVSSASDKKLRVLVVPVLLSYGGIENGIRKRLDGLDHVMSPKGLLPDQRAAEWVQASARDAER